MEFFVGPRGRKKVAVSTLRFDCALNIKSKLIFQGSFKLITVTEE